jgi:hypothetical protein
MSPWPAWSWLFKYHVEAEAGCWLLVRGHGELQYKTLFQKKKKKKKIPSLCPSSYILNVVGEIADFVPAGLNLGTSKALGI